jgi:hypothetical protein
MCEEAERDARDQDAVSSETSMPQAAIGFLIVSAFLLAFPSPKRFHHGKPTRRPALAAYPRAPRPCKIQGMDESKEADVFLSEGGAHPEAQCRKSRRTLTNPVKS